MPLFTPGAQKNLPRQMSHGGSRAKLRVSVAAKVALLALVPLTIMVALNLFATRSCPDRRLNRRRDIDTPVQDHRKRNHAEGKHHGGENETGATADHDEGPALGGREDLPGKTNHGLRHRSLP